MPITTTTERNVGSPGHDAAPKKFAVVYATQEMRDFASRLTLMKDEAYRLGLHRTGRLLEIPIQEIGWEMAGERTPPEQKARQQETLTP